MTLRVAKKLEKLGERNYCCSDHTSTLLQENCQLQQRLRDSMDQDDGVAEMSIVRQIEEADDEITQTQGTSHSVI